MGLPATVRPGHRPSAAGEEPRALCKGPRHAAAVGQSVACRSSAGSAARGEGKASDLAQHWSPAAMPGCGSAMGQGEWNELQAPLGVQRPIVAAGSSWLPQSTRSSVGSFVECAAVVTAPHGGTEGKWRGGAEA